MGAAAPSQGTAVIGGFPSISMRARKSLGFCPQHDTLWDDLTVQDHVDFVLRLRGVRGKKTLEEKRNTLLKEVELRAKKRYTAKSLSGGMRRRLSVALAFAGDPPNVVLDEPTAGVDPRARRQIQNLLLKKAKGKAVLITTHHLVRIDVDCYETHGYYPFPIPLTQLQRLTLLFYNRRTKRNVWARASRCCTTAKSRARGRPRS